MKPNRSPEDMDGPEAINYLEGGPFPTKSQDADWKDTGCKCKGCRMNRHKKGIMQPEEVEELRKKYRNDKNE